MTIYDMHQQLYSKISNLNGDEISVQRLKAIVSRLNNLSRTHGSNEVEQDIEKIVKRIELRSEHLSKIESYLNRIDAIIAGGISGTSAGLESTKTTDMYKSANQKFIDFLPIIIAVVVLGIGLSLGLTVFNDSQDTLYFVLESIKDLVGSAVSYLFAKQCVSHKSSKKNNVAFAILGSIFGLMAFVFSIVLWVGSNISIIERFTQWGKLTYLWMSLTLAFIAIICAVSVVWFLLTYHPKKR